MFDEEDCGVCRLEAGRKAERADVVAYLDDILNRRSLSAQDLVNVELGMHVGASKK